MSNEPIIPASGNAPAPGIVVVPEWFGLNDGMRTMAGRFAAGGVHALPVDIFGGQVTTDTNVAMQLVQALQMPDAVEVVRAAVKRLLADPRCNGKVFVTGFCIGGAVALAASCFVPELAGAIPFYGVPPAHRVDWPKRACPILGHYGMNDHGIPKEKVEAMAQAARVSPAPIQIHFYDAGHAFMRKEDPSMYVADAATLAWSRTLEFVRST